MNVHFLLIPVFLPLVLGAVSYFIPFRAPGHRNAYVMASLLVSAAAVWVAALWVPETTLPILQFTDQLSFSLRLDGAGRLFCITKMKQGVSSGVHTHTGDFETYYIIKGKALANDNGTMRELNPGDMMQCRDGEFHSIESIGEEELEYIAVIMYSR